MYKLVATLDRVLEGQRATDVRIAAEGAYFRPAGINNGLTAAELGLSYLLPRAIGSSRAFEIMLSGREK